MADGLGLSVGATNLTAVVVDRTALRRSPVLTLYPHRPPEVGVPGENPNLTERGLVITDFVERVGDPVGIVAADGSTHRGEVLLADALRALLLTVTWGRPPADPIAVTYPAHWRPPVVSALRQALAVHPELADAAVVSEAEAALTALQHDPGVPTRGVIALCDFGGTGTNVTLVDAANGYRPIAPTMRHSDLSGDLIDQALLTHVIDDLAQAGSVDLSGTSAIGSLSRLRAQCRGAKERLSTAAVTSLPVELPGHHSDVRLTRNELDDAIRLPVTEFVAAVQGALDRAGVGPRDLVAVASTGGGARIPIVTTMLSEQFRLPIVTTAQPELTTAIGGGLRAVRGTVEEGSTSMAAAAASPATMAAPLVPEVEPPPASAALAWSDADDLPDLTPPDPYAYPEAGFLENVYSEGADGAAGARPPMQFDEPEPVAPLQPKWYRRPAAKAGAGVAVLLAALAGAVVFVARDDSTTTPASTSTKVSESAPAPQPATAAPPAAPASPPDPQTEVVTQQAPAPVVQPQPEQEQAPAPPPAATEAPPPPPTTTTEAPPPPTTTEPPVTTTVQTTPPQTTTEAPTTTTQPPWSPTAPYPTIPGLPWVPAPGHHQAN